MKKVLKRHNSPETITSDGLCFYQVAVTTLGRSDKQAVGRWVNNRVENSHLTFERLGRAIVRFRQMKSLWKFASVHASVHNDFNLSPHIADRKTFKVTCIAHLAEWQNLMARPRSL